MVIQSRLTSWFFPIYSANPPQPHPISSSLSPDFGLSRFESFLYLFICASYKFDFSFSKIALE